MHTYPPCWVFKAQISGKPVKVHTKKTATRGARVGGTGEEKN